MRTHACFLVAGLLAAPATAHAFCGFFVAGSDAKLTNNASQVALLRKGRRTSMTLSNNYQGPPEDFAMVVPVPVVLHKEDVKTLPHDVFDHIDSLSAPRLVEYWEQDPCYRPPRERVYKMSAPVDELDGAPMDDKPGHFGVKIEAQFVVGEYEIVILSAEESTGLDQWLRANHYRIPDGAAAALAPYVRQQMKFFVAKVDIKKVQRDGHGAVQLSPLRVSFESDEVRLPVRLGLLNASGKQDLIVYLLHPTARFEAANYPNVFVPTNLEVANEVRQSFPAFYAELFDATMARHQGRAVVTEYAWQTTSCDPCPVPPLQPGELVTLGDDGPAVPDEQAKANPGGYYGNFSSWVLTRLHTRYDREALSEDLVFREAPPLEGGRAGDEAANGDPLGKIVNGGENNFQGRYIIRHYWAGAVQCKNPHYGEWGGPPSGGASRPVAARGLAAAQRGRVKLARVVRSPVPALGLRGAAPHKKSR